MGLVKSSAGNFNIVSNTEKFRHDSFLQIPPTLPL